ncbi:MAG: GWxTD domain-containing protein [Cytophagaceae bacterium]|nr:GWxTD domain-containing protein [Cytophagaceae bacterium]
MTLSETGTYLLTQNPQDVADGYGFIVVDKRYPRQTMAGDMREPLVYMSTQKEIDILRNTEDPKDAIDLYFLNICKGNQSTARQMIKNYYRRVSDANRLFSNYKEGWKTDKGMVYIIMGPPSRVQKKPPAEVFFILNHKIIQK